ncbi:MAG TPA: peptidylprolyl isomerase [Flavobacteriaceae bacterium]|nr:peptidylprolyl isomerase [Flavobacteriaceae bacterium]HBS12957.1 peptidylprolyl isomerase [Flavobacteriaceae bacterium]
MEKLIFFITILLLTSCSQKVFKEKWIKKEAPKVFKARFETTKGNFDIEAHRQWSPKAVDRLYQLISNNFYTDIALFRVVPNYVAQFGIHDNSSINKSWSKYKIADEPVIKENLERTISFARGGKESRTTQIFINLKNNSPRLDTLFYGNVEGFPVVAKVTKGMDVVKSFYSGYQEKPSNRQDSIEKYGNIYLKNNFPKLDYIKKAYIVK